jgi:hypothetical protein
LAVVGVVALLALAPAAQGAGPDVHYTHHSQTATASCSDGGGGFTVDANALFGQQTQVDAWNRGDHGTTCSVTPN